MATLAKVFGIGAFLVVMIFLIALVGTLFFYAGWNWGIVPAFNLHEIGLSTAFWLSICLSTVGGMFKTSVTTNPKG